MQKVPQKQQKIPTKLLRTPVIPSVVDNMTSPKNQRYCAKSTTETAKSSDRIIYKCARFRVE